LPLVDNALIMDNSSEQSEERVIARKNKGKSLDIVNGEIWKKMEEIAYES